MDGYLKDEEKTREAFEHGWFHSGDMGLVDEDHLLKFVDRTTDMIKSGGGDRLDPESRVGTARPPRVEELAVVGLPHERWGEAMTAFVVPVDDADADPEAVAAYARDRLAGFEAPKAVEFVETLPKTSTGKIQKYQLAQAEADSGERDLSDARPDSGRWSATGRPTQTNPASTLMSRPVT